ncbi:hypothetical protein NE237_029398 [Protea cynaroides]|uniref:Uncharacterized protein n=1 Tax=Protea cynaroides TaxID=273540 RepID=A0A9Q0GR36_9MAGN|nr:hypothetical protein NE237_029398 [Protea cynaroides]
MSFRRPGAVPFKWEIQPGVPNHNQPSIEPSPKLTPPPAGAGIYSYPPHELGSRSQSVRTRFDPPIEPSPKLTLPPAGAGNYSNPPHKLGSRSRSDRTRFDQQSWEEVSTGSVGCFPPLLMRKGSDKKRNGKIEAELDDITDPDTMKKTFPDLRSSSRIDSPSRFLSGQSWPKIGLPRRVGSLQSLFKR